MARLSSSRSKWKGVYSKIKYNLIERIHFLRKKQGHASLFKYRSMRRLFIFARRTYSRASVLLPEHAGQQHLVTSGRMYGGVRATSDHVGYRLGEFTHTTRRGSRIHRENAKTKKMKSSKK